MKKERESYIDIAKGLGVLFVIIGHNISTPEYIYSFHMPMFFILSGMVSNKSEKNNFLKKYNNHIVNYIFYSTILISFWILIGKKMEINYNSSTTVMNGIIGFFTFYNIEGISSMRWGAPMWFFPTLFLIQILSNKINILWIFIIIILLFTYDLNYIFNFKTIFLGLTFYKIGNYYSKEIIVQKILSKKIIIVIMFFFSILLFKINGRVDLANAKLGKSFLLFYIVALLGSFFWIEISKLLNKNKFLEFLGINSVVFIVFHERALTFIKGVSIYIFKIPIYNNNISLIMYTLLQLMICFFIVKIDKKYFQIIKNKLKIKEKNEQSINSFRSRVFENK